MRKCHLICIAAAASLLHAWGQPRAWESLRGVQTGQRIVVTTRGGEVIEGRFQEWSPAGLSLLRGQRAKSVTLPDVQRVSEARRASRWKGAMWGALIGFAALFPCGAASAGYVTDQNNPRIGTRIGIGAGTGMFGAGIGAAIGALSGGTRFVTVYQAERPR